MTTAPLRGPLSDEERKVWTHFAELDKTAHACSGPFPLMCRDTLSLDHALRTALTHIGQLESPKIEEVVAAKTLLREHVQAQFCSDWLKQEIERLFSRIAELEDFVKFVDNHTQEWAGVAGNLELYQALSKLRKNV